MASPLGSSAAAPAALRLVIGLGNTLRSDDGAGALLARHAARWCRSRTAGDLRPDPAGMAPAALVVRWLQQLTPELAADLSRSDAVLFLDAWHAPRGARPSLMRLAPSAPALQSHRLEPAALLALSEGLYGRAPRAWLLRIPAGCFGHGTALSAALRARLPEAQALLEQWLRLHAPA